MTVLPDLTVVAFPPKPGRRAGRQPQFDGDLIVRLYDQGVTLDEIMARVGCSLGTVRRYVAKAGRPARRPRQAKAKRRVTRHKAYDIHSRPATLPPLDHPALVEARTVYPSTVIDPGDHPRCLISGDNNRKIGGQVLKGPWRGMPVYTLTLEERATCPTSCRHWRSCYCNNLQWAKRFRHGPELEHWLPIEVAMLARAHRGGFVVRLHVAGDFYSVDYVNLWARLLDQHPELHVFGFTARTDEDDPICQALIDLTAQAWPRFAMRFSNAPVDECSTVSIEHPVQKPADAIICPQQQGRTTSCSTCGLCWHSRRRIAFLQH